MMVVSDIEDVFVPLVDGFLVSPQEARSVVDRYVWVQGSCLMMFISAKISHGLIQLEQPFCHLIFLV